MGYDEIAHLREPVEKYLAAPPRDPVALAAARETVTLIWREHETSVAARRNEARFLSTPAAVLANLIHRPGDT